MSKSTFQSRKGTAQTSETHKKGGLIGIAIGIAAVILIAVITYFVWPKQGQVTKLIVKDLTIGTGREAKIGDTLIVEYVGWVYGEKRSNPFDTSGSHEMPFEFVLGKKEAIAGWDQGLVGMKVGGTRKLTIPSNLAYGDKGALNGRIPPNSALLFEVELLDVSTPLAELPPTNVKELKVEDQLIGTGAEAKIGKTLSMHYTGYLEDGTQFDSSRDRGQPIQFILGEGQVIQGWDRGLMGMKVGGMRKLTIPPDLGYGAKGATNYIPPNAALIFEVELLAVN